MNLKKEKKHPRGRITINYDEDANNDTFDYFEDDDPFKEIIIS